MEDWKSYVDKTKDSQPRRLLVKALPFVENRGSALDIGAGALNESRYLIAEGFVHVTALDKNPVAADIAASLSGEKFEYVAGSIENSELSEKTFDLVNAQSVLAFINPESFDSTWEKILASLRPGGIITGQFFGDRDEWNGTAGMTFHSVEDANELLQDLNVISFEEEENDKKTAVGNMKHWHVLHFIARKPHTVNENLSDS